VAPTLPSSYSWFPVGQRLRVAYEAPQERRLNTLGAYFSHGPCAGAFVFETWATVPKSRAKRPRKSMKSMEERAREHGLLADEVGTIDGPRLVRFLWKVAERPASCPPGWKRERPLVIALDNYSVHKSHVVQEEVAALEAADVHLFYLPSYSPELSDIEPIWSDVKYHEMPVRSYTVLGQLKRAWEEALQRKADKLLVTHGKTEPLPRQST
jgi:DDE superfamily endonuclease